MMFGKKSARREGKTAYERVLKRHRSAYDAARLLAEKAVFLELRLKGAIERSRLEIARLHAHRLEMERGGFSEAATRIEAVTSDRRRTLSALELELNATRRSTKQAIERAFEHGSRMCSIEMERLANLSCLERRALLDRLEVDAASFDVAGEYAASDGHLAAVATDSVDARDLAAVREAAEAARARDSLDAELLSLDLAGRTRLLHNDVARPDPGLFDM
ncbi:MAG: hypothetical protein H6729_05640 [Deltaproteobacteria bacterium]|nr:hypothetical protein [Deltaproteobacteria bacterium]